MKFYKIMLALIATFALAGACNSAQFGGKKKSKAPGPAQQPIPCVTGKDCPDVPGTNNPDPKDPGTDDPQVCAAERAKCEDATCRDKWKACDPDQPHQNDDRPGQHGDVPAQHDLPTQHR